MAHWLVVVPRERHVAERLYHHDALELPAEHGSDLADGDDVVVAAGEPPMVFGLGRVEGRAHGEEQDPDDPVASGEEDPDLVSVRYTHRLLDDPMAVNGTGYGMIGRPRRLDDVEFAALTSGIGAQHSVTAPKRNWLVGVELPVEASSPAEAVRLFWSYVREFGPRELPAFVSPSGDELAMQAYVLGEEANLDPEEEE
ncbi:MAG TPA: hypothetical protein VFZ32_17420 [Micromonosporaceae bacterium]